MLETPGNWTPFDPSCLQKAFFGHSAAIVMVKLLGNVKNAGAYIGTRIKLVNRESKSNIRISGFRAFKAKMTGLYFKIMDPNHYFSVRINQLETAA